MKRIAIVAILTLLSINALADSERLDILGLILGLSISEDVKNAGEPVPGHNNEYREGTLVLLKIAGHKMPCTFAYLNGTFEAIACRMGDNHEYATKATCEVIYNDLVKEFTQKFGEPYAKGPQVTKWWDASENELIMQRARFDNFGVMMLRSSKHVDQVQIGKGWRSQR